MPKIRCSTSGLWFSVTTQHKQDLIKRFGSEEKLAEGYVSRDARRLMKEGKTVEEIKKMVEAGELVSKTTAPTGTRGRKPNPNKVAKPKKVKVEEPEEAEEAEEAEEVDEDVANFLAK